MNRFLPGFLLLFFCWFSTPVISQTNDAGLWTSIGVKKKLTPKVFVSFTEDVRLNENFSEVATILSDVGGGFEFGAFEIAGYYRYILKRQLDDYYQRRHRFYIDLSAKKKINRVTLVNRVRFQNQYEGFRAESMFDSKNYLREAVRVKFRNDSRLQPYASGEVFLPLFGEEYFIDNVRIKAGVDYEPNERHEFEFGYMVQREFNVKAPGTDFVVILGYKFKL